VERDGEQITLGGEFGKTKRLGDEVGTSDEHCAREDSGKGEGSPRWMRIEARTRSVRRRGVLTACTQRDAATYHVSRRAASPNPTRVGEERHALDGKRHERRPTTSEHRSAAVVQAFHSHKRFIARTANKLTGGCTLRAQRALLVFWGF
jgi:hypothetical protein